MDQTEDYVETLLNMGFPSEHHIRAALKLSKNDMNEAITILTSENPGDYDGFEHFDIEMKEVSNQTTTVNTLPPAYDEITDCDASNSKEGCENEEPAAEENSLEFPVPNLIELENRVYTESWSIPYKKHESLGKCLMAATRLAEQGLCETDENCMRFLDKCIPECMHKLMNASAVNRWSLDIQEGVYDMLLLFVDMVARRLSYSPIPTSLLHILALILNPDTEYHRKNRNRRVLQVEREAWFDILGVEHAKSSTYDWLCNLLNRFDAKDGLEHIQRLLKDEKKQLTAPEFAALIAPYGSCAALVNVTVVKPLLEPGLLTAVQFVQNLGADQLKHKSVISVCDLLVSIKMLSLAMWPDDDAKLDALRLEFVLRLLTSPHFNARMNGLKEITKMIDESCGSKVPKTALDQRRITEWLHENKVLAVALEGNIDQAQYCEKIKKIVEFLGAQLTPEELTKIWNMQRGQTNLVIDNIHSLIVTAAVRFGQPMLEHFILLVRKAWETEPVRMREKLLKLVGQIGRDTTNSRTTTYVLELLWELAHVTTLSTGLMESALDEHLAVLSDAASVKDTLRKQYVIKCVEDIKEGKWVLPALKHLLQITKHIAKNTFHKAEKTILQELNKNYDIIKQVVGSLIRFHEAACRCCERIVLTPDVMIDNRYTHRDYVTTHLQFLQFILQQEVVLHLPWNRARDLWNTLISNPRACAWDRQTAFEWFTKGINDLEHDTQSQLFQKEFLKLDPAKLTNNGFTCYKTYFESVNQNEHRLKKTGTVPLVEKLELIGLDFLWEICLNVQDNEISEKAMELLITMSYTNLNPRLKKDPDVLHRKFIDECSARLTGALSPGGRAVHRLLADASRVLAAPSVPEFGTVPCPARTTNILNMERLLLIAEKYILAVEEGHSSNRAIPPHGASFHGHPLTLDVTCENPKIDFDIKVHSNQTVGSLRTRIAKKLNLFADNLQLVVNEQILTKEQKLLWQMGIEDRQVVSAKSYSATLSSSLISRDSAGSRQLSFDHEQEKMLPGVMMATSGQVFDLFYQLADIDEPKITSRVRSLLNLIPTDSSVQEALDSLSLSKKPPRPPSMDLSSVRSHSPKKSSASASPVPTPPTTPTMGHPRETLRALFDNRAHNMSTFRLLYNLEVLSSKLMPTTSDLTMQKSARAFCEDFLHADGLSFVVKVLHCDVLTPEVDYETRQGCYTIALQLLRFLLCGENAFGALAPESRTRRERHGSSSSAGGGGRRGRERTISTSATVGSTRERTISSSGTAGTGRERLISSSGGSGRERTISASVGGLPSVGSSGSLVLENTTASRAVQTMGVGEFRDTVACFMRVAWAAAAGRLHLASSQPIKDYNIYSSSKRQSSTGSNNSTGSEGDSLCLHPGVCLKEITVSATDAHIAKESLELLVTCLKLRSPLLASFYTLPFVADFLVELLVNSSHEEVRDAAVEQFWLLACTEVPPGDGPGLSSGTAQAQPGGTGTAAQQQPQQQSPKHFILDALQHARLPFWVSSSSTRASSQRLLKQCRQYFDLKCRLLHVLTAADQKQLGVDVKSTLQDEIGWLLNFVPTSHTEDTDNQLIAAHLKLIRTLVTCEGVDKQKIGSDLIEELLRDFLFPAARLMEQSSDNDRLFNIAPKCSEVLSRIEAFELLTELCTGCHVNLQNVCRTLVDMHHRNNTEAAHQWEFMPPVDGRSKSGFVGLRNGGATCYMNSVLQQLFMIPGVKDAILATEDDSIDEESVYYQLQQILAHLLESRLQYYVPERFWKVFKLWGQPVNIREQQDAFDFYQAVIDQVDEHLKDMGKESFFKKKFQGVFSDQKICKGCPHRYEREEIFYALNVTVKNATLQDSLAQFVKGELLEGDNAYFCEKCGEKRDTVKRMCIKQLPPVLCIQLKRFDFDWEANRALKFDDHFKFPWVLDMEPFTSEGMSRREADSGVSYDSDSPSDTSGLLSPGGNVLGEGEETPMVVVCVPNTPSKQINYELVGIVVHSGQANAGHYYSFIKDRRGSYMSNPSKGKWYKFNDTEVEQFDMTDAALEEECFGGPYKAKLYDQSSSYPEERLRYWNGYLLLYERIDGVRTPLSAKKTKITMRKSLSERMSTKRNSDSLVELTELVHKGEKKGLFSNTMPAHIQRAVQEENLKFLQNRGVFDHEYFRFVRMLAGANTEQVGHTPLSEKTTNDRSLESLQLAVHFLFNTYFRTKRKLRSDMNEWKALLDCILEQSKAATVWFVEYLASPQGRAYLTPFLLECSTKDIRHMFGDILESVIRCFFSHGGMPLQKCFDEFLETLLHMLNKDVADHCKHCTHYLNVLLYYAQMDTKSCSHLFGRRAFHRLAFFLLGEPSSNSNGSNEQTSRRWSSVQSRDFGPLHETMATLVLHCDLSPYRTEALGDTEVRKPRTCNPQPYLKMNIEMSKYVFGKDMHRYVKEAVYALREVPGHLPCVEDMLLCCSFANLNFSLVVLKNIMWQYTTAPSNELKQLLATLLKILLLEDSLQTKRLETVIDGFTDSHDTRYSGMLAVIKNDHLSDSRRAYQCIKLLVSLAQQCELAKDLLLQRSATWQWSVNWLKNKMSENCWPTSSTGLSNESSESKTFQRTISAQGTLDGATALLVDLDPVEMDTQTQSTDLDTGDTQSCSQLGDTQLLDSPSDQSQSPDCVMVDEYGPLTLQQTLQRSEGSSSGQSQTSPRQSKGEVDWSSHVD